MHARSFPGTINFPTQTAFNKSLRLGRAQNFSHPHRRLQSKNFVTKILTFLTLVLLFKLRIFSAPLLYRKGNVELEEIGCVLSCVMALKENEAEFMIS